MYTYKCKIIKVIDGDTVDIEIDLGFNIRLKERIRLHGVDTPEIFGANASELGKQASIFTKKWVETHTDADGYFQYTSLKYDSKDKYGRGLGTISFIYKTTGTTSILNEDLKIAGHTK